jgi:PhzF family phenazine biosynthesis protein
MTIRFQDLALHIPEGNMATRPYLQLDVFAHRPGAGNALGVVVDGRDFDTAAMQAFANWTNLSETTFVLPPTVPEASYRVRIFTPKSELPFAGHPSVGTAHAVLEAGLARPVNGRLVQECAAGLLPVRVDGDGATRMIFVRAPRSREIAGDDQAAAMLRAALGDCRPGALKPALLNNGPSWWCVELADESEVRTMTPDLPRIAALTQATGAVGLAVFARCPAADYQIVVRAYCPADGIPEDPVTGSVNASIAAYLSAKAALGSSGRRYAVSQGRELGRDGRIEVEIDADGEVWIGGQTQTVIRGELNGSFG